MTGHFHEKQTFQILSYFVQKTNCFSAGTIILSKKFWIKPFFNFYGDYILAKNKLFQSFFSCCVIGIITKPFSPHARMTSHSWTPIVFCLMIANIFTLECLSVSFLSNHESYCGPCVLCFDGEMWLHVCCLMARWGPRVPGPMEQPWRGPREQPPLSRHSSSLLITDTMQWAASTQPAFISIYLQFDSRKHWRFKSKAGLHISVQHESLTKCV